MNQRRIIGIFVVLVGGLFLLNALNVDINPWGIIGTYWPVIIIALGAFNLVGPSGIRVSGIIMIGVGVLFLMNTVGFSLFGLDPWDVVLPALIIIVGFRLLMSKSGENMSSRHFIKQTVIFSGADIRSDSDEFQGAELNTIFGGLELDLRDVKISEDGPAKIEVMTAFGGTDIIVSEDAKVMVTGIPLFGGWSNKSNKVSQSGEADIIINALVMFGGLEVKTSKGK